MVWFLRRPENARLGRRRARQPHGAPADPVRRKHPNRNDAPYTAAPAPAVLPAAKTSESPPAFRPSPASSARAGRARTNGRLRAFTYLMRKPSRMNGFVSASRPRTLRTLWSAAALALLACAIPLHAAAPGKPALSKSSAPADLRAAIRRTLGGDGWVQMQDFTETDPGFDPEFGVSVALHGTTAMVGAQQAKIGDNDGQGAVYVFEKTNGVWIETQKLVSSDGQASDLF